MENVMENRPLKKSSEMLVCNPFYGGCGYRGTDWFESFLNSDNRCPNCGKRNTGVPAKELQSDLGSKFSRG